MKRSPLPLMILVLFLAAGPVAAGPFDNLNDSESFLDNAETRARVARLDSLTTGIHLGIVEMKRHYIRGAATPLPPVIAFEFLRLRSLHTGRAELEEEALGLSAAWLSLHLPTYLRHGLPVDPENPGGPTRKGLAEEAGLLEIAVLSYQASQKEMFQKAAERLADDLIGWAIPGDQELLGEIGVDPDTIRGGPASPDDRYRAASALALAGAVFGRPDWLERAGGAGVNIGIDWPSDTSAVDYAHSLLAGLDAVMALGYGMDAQSTHVSDLDGYSRSLVKMVDAAPTADDWNGAAWASLALARYGTWAHDEDALRAATRWADFFGEIPVPAAKNIVRFRAEAAAAYALQFLASPSPMAYIVADPGDARGRELRNAALSSGRPGRLVACHARNEENLLYPAAEDGPIAYVCSGELCAPPTSEPGDVRDLLRTFSLPETAPRGDPSGDPK